MSISNITEQQWQVEQRKGLPAVIKSQLLPLAREQWSEHARYGGKASFFIQYHSCLLFQNWYIYRYIDTFYLYLVWLIHKFQIMYKFHQFYINY